MVYSMLFLLWFSLLTNTYAKSLQPGDIILQPLNCKLCSMIESESNSIYSHIGIVVATQKGQTVIAEAYGGRVQAVPLSEFLAKTENGQRVLVRRSKEIAGFSFQKQKQFAKSFAQFFNYKFFGKLYDHFFSFDDEKYYCSELVFKMLNPFLKLQLKTHPMTFDRNREFWEMYFQGHVPEGEPGIAPADFEHSKLFFTVN